MSMRVLDTAALLHWPLPQLSGCVVFGQREELARLSPDREMLLEGADLQWSTPSNNSLELASKVATESGDLAGLSSVDLEILALALELEAILVTDDYRLQNCCLVAGIEHQPVLTDGISERWLWQLVCPGCGATSDEQNISKKRGEYGNCGDCGSPYNIRKK